MEKELSESMMEQSALFADPGEVLNQHAPIWEAIHSSLASVAILV